MSKLEVVDTFVIGEDAKVTGWTCAMNAVGLTTEKVGECAAPRGECPRGFTESQECKKYGVDD